MPQHKLKLYKQTKLIFGERWPTVKWQGKPGKFCGTVLTLALFMLYKHKEYLHAKKILANISNCGNCTTITSCTDATANLDTWNENDFLGKTFFREHVVCFLSSYRLRSPLDPTMWELEWQFLEMISTNFSTEQSLVDEKGCFSLLHWKDNTPMSWEDRASQFSLAFMYVQFLVKHSPACCI